MMRPFTVFVTCILLVLVLTGCNPRLDKNAILGDEIGEIDQQPIEEATASLADKTVRTYSRTYGNQIEYFAPDGRAYLWYPGNNRPVPSKWRLEHHVFRYKICFLYPSSSYDAVTKERGGNWECRFLNLFADSIVEIEKSDIFNLSSGILPYKLSPQDFNFNALKARMK
ncbi:hypothetical protein NBZ79_12990 [Sneathiella marina]|uniref:Uncharacterized protein n=1 Tax=Sneathiella marina TaxID=2950108 RepID=A0ABY4VZ06_9PROT|nr:hypothetical protein [Sneathiella marina]USG60090.1 hypothetical protein NBZ79_12990 [Sneathiella marina]